MLTDQNKELLEALEAKYVAMLGVVNDFAKYDIGDALAQAELEKYIFNQQQEIHAAALVMKGAVIAPTELERSNLTA